MHSRIIELSKDPILKHERMCESSVPDWFYHSIADYTDADTDRDHDIKWFLDAVARVVDVAEDGKSFTFKPKAKQKYFERQYHAFLDKACELTGISLDAFVGEAKYDIGMAMYHLMRRYQVDVPLRTQGWINDKLISVTIENGKCEHLRYMRSKGAQCSQKIFDCMHELILKVCLETEG